ncbi:MAG: heme-binding protein, partial [Verrucomicrobiota bacterium]
PEVHPDGFTLERVYTVDSETQGSWVSMAADDQGRLYCCDQKDKGIFRLTFGAGEPKVEKMPVEVTGAQGLLWLNGSLYAGVNGGKPSSGLFRITDSTGDDILDKVELLRAMKPGGEHGIHAVVAGPDKKSLYILGGNYSAIPDPESSAFPLNYGEDQLLPSMPDARGHAKNINAPGGWVAQTDLDGKNCRLIASGFRNQYDAAFNAHGELFTYDSDMEWDLGTPWYRPTRMYHVTAGGEFGWRKGSGKFPEWFPDVLPPAMDVGPGSPTGVLSGLGAKFPAKYQNAIYAFDWTYGTMYALHQKPKGASYELVKEEFVTGAPLNLTDGAVSSDGHLYFAIGGRGTPSAVFKVAYTGSQSTAAAPTAPGEGADARALRKQLEGFFEEKEGAVEAAWPHLGHQDRFIRYAARMVLEHQPVANWVDKDTSGNISAELSKLLALARQGAKENQAVLQASVESLLNQTLTADQQLEVLRIINLASIRIAKPNDSDAKKLTQLLSAHFPNKDDRLNRELAYTLAALESPDIVAKTVPLLSQEPTSNSESVFSDNLLERASRQGEAFARSRSDKPQRQQMWYAYVLRNLSNGWTDDLRQQYFQWFSKARSYKGGASFQGFI